MILAQGLTKYYGDQCTVDHINLDIHRGEIMGLLGPNGAGKSTTLRMLTGFLRPTSGTIKIKDYDIGAHLLEIKKLIGYLPESAPLYHEMLVFDYLSYVADIRNISRSEKMDRISQIADLCDIRSVMHKTINELSKGYKQRVGLAHAMMSDPEILILDEPTSGLDPNQIVEIRDIIRRIGREKTIILSTHILSEAEATCDRVVIIDRGKIAADADIDTLKGLGSKEARINIALKNSSFEEAEKELCSIEGITGIKQVSGQNDSTHFILSYDSTTDLREIIYKKIKNRNWVLLEFHHEVQTLENVFRSLTREN